MNYLSVENISKAYGENSLFQNLSFGIEKGQKVAFVAPNGSGKTSIFKILMGLDTPDKGEARFRKEIKVGFLPQEPPLAPEKSIIDTILQADSPSAKALRFYEECLANDSPQLADAIGEIDNLEAWDYEQRLRQVLSRLRITDTDRLIGTLSGGQRKRVALAQLLMEQPDFWLLDEPTNHLDLDMIEWLEELLGKANVTLLMVTHDRYFLDNVCNEILEIDQQQIYKYNTPTNRQGETYSFFLEKKAERAETQASETEKNRNTWRKELDWVRRQPKARGTKAKYRVDAFNELQNELQKTRQDKLLKLESEGTRLGRKISEWKK